MVTLELTHPLRNVYALLPHVQLEMKDNFMMHEWPQMLSTVVTLGIDCNCRLSNIRSVPLYVICVVRAHYETYNYFTGTFFTCYTSFVLILTTSIMIISTIVIMCIQTMMLMIEIHINKALSLQSLH